MKKFFALILSVLLIFGATTVHATDALSVTNVEASDVTDTKVQLIEYTDNVSAVANTTDEFADVKAFLAAQGMGQTFIDMLNEAQLSRYASAIRQTNTTPQLSQIIKGDDGATVMVAPFEPITPTPDIPITYSNTYSDDWMILYLLITYLGNGKYLYSVDATWLNIPENLKIDTLGIVSQEIAIHMNSTMYGWEKYDYVEELNISPTIIEHYYADGSQYFRDGENGSYSGAAYVIYLNQVPINFAFESIYSHFEFVGSIRDFSNLKEFDVSANYDHAVVDINADASIGVSAGTSPSIGLNVDLTLNTDYHRRRVTIPNPIIYTPDN